MADEQEVQFDPSTITVAEAELIEELTGGTPYGETIRAMLTMRGSIRQVKAVAVMVKRRQDPDFTMDQIDPDTEIRALYG